MITKPNIRLLRALQHTGYFSTKKQPATELLTPRKKLYELEYAIKREAVKHNSNLSNKTTIEKMFRELDWSYKYLDNHSKMTLEKKIGDTKVTLSFSKQKVDCDRHQQMPMYQKLDPYFNQAGDMLEQVIAGNEELRDGVVFDRFVEIKAEIKGPQKSEARFIIRFINGIVFLKEMQPFPNSKVNFPGQDKIVDSVGLFFKDNEFHLESALLEYLRLFGINSEFCERICAVSYYLELVHKAKFFSSANAILESS
jgi:hypothetical protein